MARLVGALTCHEALRQANVPMEQATACRRRNNRLPYQCYTKAENAVGKCGHGSGHRHGSTVVVDGDEHQLALRDLNVFVRIGAAMGVYGPDERFELTALDHDGWLGAKAEGDFGQAEGWVQVVNGAAGPEGFGDAVAKGGAKMCGRDRSGKVVGG